MNKIYKELHDSFGLNEKHIAIIKVLEYEQSDAKSISRLTDIPLGRIYDNLNQLINVGLIQRTKKKPFTYSIRNLNENVIGFMKGKIDSMIASQNKIIDSMKGSGKEDIEIFTSNKEFTKYHLNMISESKVFKYISIHNSFPFILYPFDLNRFIALRKAIVSMRPTITSFDEHVALLVFRTYKKALEDGVKMVVLFEKKSFLAHIDVIKGLGKAFFNKWKNTILSQLETYGTEVYIIDEYLPMQLDLNERRVNFALRHLGITSGIVFSSKEVCKFYNHYFEQNLKRSENIVEHIKRIEFEKK